MVLKKIAGYEIQNVLGEGGMGVVYRARDVTLDRSLAIKLIHPASLGSQGKERFLREARLDVELSVETYIGEPGGRHEGHGRCAGDGSDERGLDVSIPGEQGEAITVWIDVACVENIGRRCGYQGFEPVLFHLIVGPVPVQKHSGSSRVFIVSY